jgi:phage-related protein
VVRLTNALGAEKILPLTMSFKRVPLDFDVPIQPLSGRDGAVKTGKTTLRERQFILEGGIYHNTRQELDSILSFLMHPPIEVYRQHYHDRFLKAEPLGAPQDWANLDRELTLRIPMIAMDPYWYGQEVVEQITGTQTITVDGTAPTHPLIATTGPVSNLTVYNALTGKSVVVDGATGVVEVDNDQFAVTVSGTNRLDLVNENWLLHGWELLPGENQITTNTPITVTYRPRWY